MPSFNGKAVINFENEEESKKENIAFFRGRDNM